MKPLTLQALKGMVLRLEGVVDRFGNRAVRPPERPIGHANHLRDQVIARHS